LASVPLLVPWVEPARFRERILVTLIILCARALVAAMRKLSALERSLERGRA
jgi:hypothetical protein